jgi:hypothetical protein
MTLSDYRRARLTSQGFFLRILKNPCSAVSRCWLRVFGFEEHWHSVEEGGSPIDVTNSENCCQHLDISQTLI